MAALFADDALMGGSEALDFAMIASTTPCTAAAVFTTNKFQAAPVIASRTLLQSQVIAVPHPLSHPTARLLPSVNPAPLIPLPPPPHPFSPPCPPVSLPG